MPSCRRHCCRIRRLGCKCSMTCSTAPTVAKSLRHLEALGVVKEVTGRRRGREFAYTAHLNLLAQGTELL